MDKMSDLISKLELEESLETKDFSELIDLENMFSDLEPDIPDMNYSLKKDMFDGIDNTLPNMEEEKEDPLLLFSDVVKDLPKLSEEDPLLLFSDVVKDLPKLSEEEEPIDTLRDKIVREMILISKKYNKDKVIDIIKNRYPDYFSSGKTIDELYKTVYNFSNVECKSDDDCYNSKCLNNKCSNDTSCIADEECLPNELCYNNKCIDKDYRYILMNMLFKANPNLISLGIPTFLKDGRCDYKEDLLYRKTSIIKGHMQSGKTQFMIAIAFRYLLCNVSTVIALRNSIADIQQIKSRIEKEWREWKSEIKKYVDVPERDDIFVSSSGSDRFFKNLVFGEKPHIVFVLSNPKQLEKILKKMQEGEPRSVVLLVDESDQLLGQKTIIIPPEIDNFLINSINILNTRNNEFTAETLLKELENPVINPTQPIVNQTVPSEIDLINYFRGNTPIDVKKARATPNELLGKFRIYIDNAINNYSTVIDAKIVQEIEGYMNSNSEDLINVYLKNNISVNSLVKFRKQFFNAQSAIILNKIKDLSYSTFAVSATIFDNLFNIENIKSDNIIMLDPPSDYYGVDSINYVLIKRVDRNIPISSPSPLDNNITAINVKTNIQKYLKYFNDLATIIIKTPSVNKIMPNISLIKIATYNDPLRALYQYIVASPELYNIIPILWIGTAVTLSVDCEYLGLKLPNIPMYTSDIKILEGTPEEKRLKFTYFRETREFYFEEKVTGIQNILTFLQTYMPKNIESKRLKNIAILTGKFADRGINFSSAIRPDTWHLNHMYYIPSEDVSDPDILQAVGRLCGRFNNDTIKLYLFCTEETQVDVTNAYKTQEAFIREYKTKSNKNMLKGLTELKDIETPITDIDIPLSRSGRRNVFKHFDISIPENVILGTIKYANDTPDNITIYKFLDKNRLQGQWIDSETLNDAIPIINKISDKDFFKIVSRTKKSLNLQIGKTKDKRIYFRIPSSVEIIELPQPIVRQKRKSK